MSRDGLVGDASGDKVLKPHVFRWCPANAGEFDEAEALPAVVDCLRCPAQLLGYVFVGSVLTIEPPELCVIGAGPGSRGTGGQT